MYIPISYKHDLKNQKSQGKMFNILDFFFIIWIKIKHANTQAYELHCNETFVWKTSNNVAMQKTPWNIL